MTQMSNDTPTTSIAFLANLIGSEVTVRTKTTRTWGPYTLLAVYPEGPLPAIVVKGSREYLIPLEQITVLHEGAKPTQAETYARKGVSVPGMPGIQIEDDDDSDSDSDD